MKITLIFPLLIVGTLAMSCSDAYKERQDNGLTITVDKFSKPIPDLKDLTSNFVELVLQDPYDDPLGIVNKVVVDGDKIFVLDSYKSKGLFVFNSKGEFQYKISKIGQAEGEFINPDDFVVDKDRQEIILLDRNKQQLLFYSALGTYLRKIDVGKYINSFALYEMDKLVLDRGNTASGDTGMALEVIEKNSGNSLITLFPIEDFKVNLTFSPLIPLFNHDNTVSYVPSMSNEVYYIENDKVYVKYRFDFAGRWASDDYLKSLSKIHPTEILKKMVGDSYVLFPNIMEVKKHIYLDYYTDLETKCHAYYNKDNGKLQHFEIGKEFFGTFSVVGSTEDSFITARAEEDGTTVLVFFSFK